MKQIYQLSIVIFIFFLSSNQLFSQCKERVDDFTGEKIISGSKSIEFSRGPYGPTYHNLFEFIKHDDDTYTLNIEFFSGSIIEQKMPKSSPIQFKLSDGSVLEIYSEESVIPTKKVNRYTATSVFNIKAKLTKENMEQLSKSSWKAIRFNIDKAYDYKPNGMQKNALKKIAKCILVM
jgi:hypothetical protein